jgi:hypothetical protein
MARALKKTIRLKSIRPSFVIELPAFRYSATLCCHLFRSDGLFKHECRNNAIQHQQDSRCQEGRGSFWNVLFGKAISHFKAQELYADSVSINICSEVQKLHAFIEKCYA